MNKRIIFTIFLLVIIIFSFTFYGCSNKKSIIGVWERQDNSVFSGMQVKVEKLNDGYQGSLIKVSNKDKETGFAVGDIKWKDIKEIKSGTYEFKDLGKGIAGDTLWYDMQLSPVDDNWTTLKLRDVAKQGEVGSEQKWIHIK